MLNLLTDLCKLPNSKAQYLALSSDLLSRPVEADLILAPERCPILLEVCLRLRLDSIVLGGQGGFLDIFPETIRITSTLFSSKLLSCTTVREIIVYRRYMKSH